MIERRLEATGIGVYAGLERIALFTPETDSEAIERFIKLCQPIEAELEAMKVDYNLAIAANMASNGHGRNYPIFSTWDRAISKLCQRAGIVDC